MKCPTEMHFKIYQLLLIKDNFGSFFLIVFAPENAMLDCSFNILNFEQW